MKKAILLAILAILSLPIFAQETVTISPSWGQSFHYANAAGNTVWMIAGIFIIAIASFVFYQAAKGNVTFFGIHQGSAVNIILFLLIVIGLVSILSKPIAVRWNNDKKVDKAYLESVGEQHIWDSLENNCLIVDGPSNCKWPGK